jgi:hypothetical protein
MILQGKGWFIWQVSRSEDGAPDAIARRAASAGLTHVLIKVAERTFGFGFDKSGRDLVPATAEALRAAGIQVWGWHYIYGENPAGEASIAVKRCNQLRLDGYVLDAEGEYKLAGRAAAARAFMKALRAGLPQTPIALSSFRYPSLHPQMPWKAFLENCDLAMPQVYWERSHNPEQQLARSAAEFANPALVGYVRPYVPTGSAYGVGNWRPTADEVTRLLNQALNLKLPAANLYSWDYAGAAGQNDLWDAAANFNWPAPRPQDIVTRYLNALNSGDVEQVLGLYHPNAGHVTAERTIIGTDDLRAWYADLLQRRLAGAEFSLQEASGAGNSRRLYWTASGAGSRVTDGDDTLGLREGLIQYHYSYFNLTAPA